MDNGANLCCGGNPSVSLTLDSSPYTGEPLRFPWGCAEREIYVLFWAAIVGAGVPDGPCEGRAEAGGDTSSASLRPAPSPQGEGLSGSKPPLYGETETAR